VHGSIARSGFIVEAAQVQHAVQCVQEQFAAGFGAAD
jgi:hypothetical protein